jgi:hypothetical protein
MGVNIGTVKSRLFHAKKGLRARMKPETLSAILDELDEDDEDDDGNRGRDGNDKSEPNGEPSEQREVIPI